jgi:nicotinate dehydrogenase subunit A
MSISIIVNGETHALAAEGSLPLIFALRNTLGLKGVRFGCGGEDCGACTVLVDGELCYSCTTTLDAVAGRHIETVDGLADNKARALRDSFVAERAGQCGYCLSGILTTAYFILRGSQRPTRADIIKILSRNLCRCGSHASIVRAIERAIATVWSEGFHE